MKLMSIAPLDRLLSQAKQRDEITVRVGCGDDDGKMQKKDFDFTFEVKDVNVISSPKTLKGADANVTPDKENPAN